MPSLVMVSYVFSFLLAAQNISSGLSGTIADQTDAMIPRARWPPGIIGRAFKS